MQDNSDDLEQEGERHERSSSAHIVRQQTLKQDKYRKQELLQHHLHVLVLQSEHFVHDLVQKQQCV